MNLHRKSGRLLVFLSLLSTFVFAGNDSLRSSARMTDPWRYFIPELAENTWKQLTSPLSFRANHWIISGITVGGTLVAIYYDEAIDRDVTHWKSRSSLINEVSPVITHLGGNEMAVPVLLYTLGGMAFRNSYVMETGLLTAQSMITSGLWIRVGKIVSGRERPSAAYRSGVPGGNWYGPSIKSIKGGEKFDAFPSGHTGTAFSIASVLSIRYKHMAWVPVTSYTLAGLVAVSRMTEHTHWLSDIILGAGIGMACGYQVCGNHPPFVRKWLNKRESRVKASWFGIPRPGGGELCMRLSF